MKNFIPDNKSGKENDLSATAVFDRHEHAVNMFRQASEKMLSPSIWHKLCGALSARFMLVDEKGNLLDRKAQPGDYIKIDLPGLGPVTGGGYDWVRVELVEYSNERKEDMYIMQVKPVPSPLGAVDDAAHFFTGMSSSTFIVHRVDNTVVSSYHGRNEEPNAATGSAIDNIRNTAVAAMAMAGVSELQWQALVDAFVSKGT